MTIWVLFVILLEPTRYYVSPTSFHETMEECFKAREVVVQSAPQPKINYEAVCIQTDKVKMQ